MSVSRLCCVSAVALLAMAGIRASLPAQESKPEDAKPAEANASALDASFALSTKLEAELTKYNDTAPESADVMMQLIDVYHDSGRVFGLIRIGQRFIAAHPQDPRHHQAMLKLMDGLEATSRNKELTVVCRQFLAKFPEAGEARDVEIRLGDTLVEMNDPAGAGEAYAAAWRRNPVAENRQRAVKAIANLVLSNDKKVYSNAALLAEEVLEALPAGEFTTHVGWQAVHQWRRGSEWAKSNLAAAKMLKKTLPATPEGLRELHSYMAENYGNLGQHANAVESLKKVRALRDEMAPHFTQILRLHYMGAKSAEMAPVVNEFMQKYPDRPERFQARSYLAHAHFRGEERPQGVAILRELLPFDAVTNSNASIFVQYSPQEPANFAEMEKTLLDAINRNAPHAAALRYSLAFEVYRDRMKDLAKARQILRDQLAQSPTNDGHTTTPCDWLLSTAADDAEFQAEAKRIFAARRENLDYSSLFVFPANWIAANRNNKDLKTRVAYLQEELKKQDADPIVKAFAQIGNSQSRTGEVHREFLLEPANIAKLNDRVAAMVARMQAEHCWYYGGNKQKQASGFFSLLAKRVPTDFYAAYHATYTAVDYNLPEVAKEAALHLVKVEPTTQVADSWYRLMITADRNADPELARLALQWILKSQAKFGKDPTYASYIGDTLSKLKLQNEAIAYWTTYMNFNRQHSESRECASRLMALKEGDAKIAFIQDMLKPDTDFIGRYAEWIAAIQFAAGDVNAFEKTLRDARKRQDERPFRAWDLTDGVAQSWLDAYRAKMDASEAEKRRIFQIIADMDVYRASGCARLAILEITPDDGKQPMKRLLAWQAPTRWMYNDSHDWDRSMPYVQSALARKEYMEAATLLTSMLSNISYVEEGRKKVGRDLVAQSYSRVGAAGFIIDEKSPVAPLMQAALYLRLGDESLAFDTYLANRQLFDEHRDEVPADLIVFVCENLIAAGGDENHNRVEDILRTWLIKNGASQVVDETLKAKVKLLLARNFYKAQRFDLARTEFTTVINQHPNTPQQVEAEFGIGETYMSQKVYDQAQIVFDKLAQSRDPEVMVRAEFLRGVLAHRRGDRDEAREIFRVVLDKVPNIELANQALYNLSEVYGAEERYIDQLNLLRTVGRLGRASKRWHSPGTSLSIVVQDSDLGISRGHNRIPVKVTTEPGGDVETIYLTSGGAGKGLFRADLETRLSQVTPNDHVLQLTGKDIIKCDYPAEFKTEFKNVPLSDVEIRIASDAKFEIASSKIVDVLAETFSQQLQREQEDESNLDQRVSQNRPANQVKPGNVVYLRVQDGDRDLSNEADKITVKLAADSGDQVQVSLTETEGHSGVFEGTVQTAELPAGALASDTSIQHSPLMAIDRDPNSFWLSEPDGATPKWLTVDMKDLKLVSRVKLFTPEADRHAPVRGTIYGSDDGLFWFRIASNPLDQPIEPAYIQEAGAPPARMTRRVYVGNHTSYTTWQQVMAISRNAKPISEEVVDELSWSLPEDADSTKTAHTVIWNGKLVQERAGAARIRVDGVRTAVAVDGYLELPLGPGARHVDVWLEPGLHDLTIFSATTNPVQPMLATFARADHNRGDVQLEPFRASDFNLETPAAKRVAEANPHREPPKGSAADRLWEFQFPALELRYVKFVIHEYLGEAVAINQVQLSGEEEDEIYVPTETDVLALSNNSVLEIAGGDVVTATYADEFTQGEGGRSRLLTSKLTATYFNGVTTPIAYDFVRQPNGAVQEIRKQVMRIDPGERFVVEVIDFDRDESDEPDTLKIQVSVNDEPPIELVATETEKYSGRFTKEVDTSATPAEGKLHVKRGDRIYCRYLDSQNTFPGHSVPRESVVYVNEPSAGQIRIYETRVIPPPAESKAPPQLLYRLPPRGQEVSGVAFESPFTVEVIDPDAARDSRSHVIVKLTTTDGATVDVKCVVSDAFASQRPGYNAYYGFGTEVRALQDGRFVGQVITQLGGKNSPQMVPLTSEMPRNLVGGPAMDEDEGKSALDKTLVTKVLNLTGKDIISATYQDAQRPEGKALALTGKGRLIANGQLACTDRDYSRSITQLHVGEKLFLMVTDFDRDGSDERDTVEVEITSNRDEKESVVLEETLAHSGIFTGSVFLKPSDMPTAGNFNPDEPAIEVYFGDDITVKYSDNAASTENGTLDVSVEIPVVIGTDGLVAAFSKTFNDEKLAVETKFHIAESYFELFKSHKKLGRESEQKEDLEAGRRVLREVMEDYPDPRYVPRIAYLLGQFSQELGQVEEAVQSYEMIVRQYPEHPLASDAQYKMAQAYEEAGNFEQALEAYVTLAATYPKSPLIPNVMIRISDHFYKSEKCEISAQVGEKFLERFDGHQFASRIAFRVGQCYFKSKLFPKAGQSFDSFAKRFPDDGLSADALFWSGESFRMANNNSEAFRRYNRCRWDHPSSEAAKYARGRLALPEMLQQFEAEANSLDNQ